MGNWATVRNLQLNGQAGAVDVPPGTYGDLTANSSSVLRLGVAGSFQPAVYNIQRLTLNGQSRLEVLGPVILHLANGFNANGLVGAAAHPEWLQVRIAKGAVQLNGGSLVYGALIAPSGTIIINGQATLCGTALCDRFILNGGGLVRWCNTSGDGGNRPPVANGQTLTTAEDQQVEITLSASDPDGNTLAYTVPVRTQHGSLAGSAPNLIYTPDPDYSGPDSFSFTVSDGIASSASATVSIQVQPVNDAPVALPGSVVVTEDTPLLITLQANDADGDPLSFSIPEQTMKGWLEKDTSPGAGAGDYFYWPFPDSNEPDSFVFRAADGQGGVSDARIQITINPINDKPQVAPLSLEVAEDGQLALTLTGTDVDGDVLIVRPMTGTGPFNGTLEGSAPDFTYRPAADFHGTDTFWYEAVDAQGHVSDPAQVSIRVVSVDDAPVAVSATVPVVEDTPVAFTVDASDIDGEPLTFRIIQPPVKGTLSGAGPDFLYTPHANVSGEDSFTFEAIDSADPQALVSAPATVILQVASVNDAPVAQPVAVVTREDVPVTITLSGSDVDGDALTYLVPRPAEEGQSFGPQHGTLTPTENPQVWIYTPALHSDVPDQFTFRVQDPEGLVSDAVVAIHVTARDNPVAIPLTLSLPEDSSQQLTLSGSGAEDTTVHFELGDGQGGGTAPANGALSGEIPELVYTPNPNYFGADQFTYVAIDSFGQRSTPALVSINVLPVNDAPVAQAQALSTDEDTPVEIHFQASDLENDPVTFLEPTEPSFGTLEPLGPGHYRYHPGANFHGADTFFYAANDGAADSVPAAVTIQVRPVNDAPEAHPQGLSTREDTPLSLVLSGSDIDGDALTILEPSTPQHGTLTRDPNDPARFTYVPHPDFHGSDSFTFAVKDGEFSSPPALVAIEVESVNDAPSGRDLAVETPEDTPVDISLPATDPDGETLRFEIVSALARGSLSAITEQGSVRYQPGANIFGEDRFVFRSIDPAGESSEATVTITIHPVNDAPVAESKIVEVLEDSSSIIGLIGEDVDGDALSYHITIQPQHGILTGSGPNIRYQPHENYSGPDSFQFVVKDATLTSAPAEVLISVLAVNDRPTAVSGIVELDEDSFVAITLNGHDEEGVPLTYRIVAPPEHGVLTGTAPDLIYTPAADYNGQDTFHFVVRDDESDSAPAIITLNVRPKNDPPTAQNLAVETAENVAVPVVLVAEDPDGDALIYSITQPPRHGALSGTAPNFTYTPRAGYFGADSFEFSASDAADATAKANVSIAVQPDARSRTFTTTEDFEEGYLAALSADPADQLQTFSDLSRFDVLWIPKSSTNTVCRLDTETGRVLSEHRVAPNAANLGYPSRVAIDSSGDAWVGDQHGGGLVKITSPESGRWVDRNNNGYLDTSTGQGDVRPWTGDANDTGSGAEDELILLRVNTGLPGVRAIAIDRSENVWVSGTGKDDPWLLIDGKTGAVLRQEPNAGRGGWMAFADFDGSLYSTGAKFLRWDTDGPISELDNRFDNVIANSWDVAKDSKGNFWVTVHYNAYVFKYSPKGELLGSYYHGRGSTEGIVIDNDDHVWIAHSHCGHTVGHLAPDGTFLGEIPIALPTELAVDRKGRVWISDYRGVVARINVLGGPLGNDGKTPLGEIDLISQSLNGNSATLGDFAGRGAAFTAGHGTWVFDYDGVIPSVSWGPLTWNTLICNDGSVTVSVAVSNDGVNYTPFQPLTLENATPSAEGRYLRGKVEIASATTGESPILYDLTVGTSGYAVPETPRYWRANAGPDLESNWPDVVELKGAWCRTAHQFDSQPTYAWTKVSGPGAVTFDDPQTLRPKVQFGANGTYVLRFSATLDGETKTDDVIVNLTPRNRSPWVDGGRDVLTENANELVKLKGSARDDGLPLGRTVEIRWEKKAGPGVVTFTNPADPQTTASFSAPGVYLLELSSYDGEFTATDMIEARVAVPCTISDIAGLNAWWQGSFDGIDHVGGNIALLERGMTFEQGKVGGSYKFDGVDDYLRLFAAPTLDVGDDAGLSMEFWMKADVLRDATLFEYGNDTAAGVSVRMRINGNLELHLVDVDGQDRVLTAAGLTAGQFRHVVITWDRATGRAVIYLDGVPKVFGDLGTKAAQTTSDLFIGVNRSGAQPFKGMLDEISLYSRALAAEEAYDLFAADIIGKCPPGSNMAPDVDAGHYLVQKAGIPVVLKGIATDDGLPAGGRFRAEWSVVAAPDQATVTFENPADLQTHATFSADGFYTLKLTATDGAIIAVDYATVPVGNDCLLEAASGLVGWWPGDGTPEDLVGGRTGEFAAGHIYGMGKVEQAFRLDGTNYVRVPVSVDEQGSNSLDVGKGSWTVELWANPDAYRLYPVLLEWQDAAGSGPVFYQNGNYLFVTTPGGGSQNSGAAVLPAGQWTHIAVSYERTTGSLRFYANGQLTAERSIGANLTFATNKDLWIGGHAGADKFRGLLDEVSIYNRALGPDEIASICEAGAVGKCRPSDNHAPRVNAGPDLGINSIEQSLTLRGSVSDDGLPEQGELLVEWKQLSGPGVATFAEVYNPQSSVSFSAAGRYELELSARDGMELARDVVEITVGQPCVIGEDASLVGWWSGNRTTEDVLGEHDGYGAFVTYEPGKVGSAFKLNGGSYVRVPVSVDEQGNNSLDVGKGSWTVELWANPDAYRLYPVLLEWRDAAGSGPVFYQNGNYLFVTTPGGGSQNSGAAVLPAGQWTHIAVSYERTTGSLRFYANGQLTAERSIGANLTFATNKDLWIGGHAGADKFRGLLDEVSIYNRALGPDEIASICEAGAVGKCRPSDNHAPRVNAGPDLGINSIEQSLTLRGSVSDDGLPDQGELLVEWKQLSGPGVATFAEVYNPQSSVSFSAVGRYELELSARDGMELARDVVEITVGQPCVIGEDASLVGWWSGNRTTEDVLGEHDGFGAFVTYEPGKVGSAFKLNGGSYVRVPVSVDEQGNNSLDVGKGSWTVELWANPDAYRLYPVLLEWRDAAGAGPAITQSGEYLYVTLPGGGIQNSGAGVLPAGQWTHIAVSYERTTGSLRFYANGQLTAERSIGANLTFATNKDLWIGGHAGADKFRGLLDEVSIYNRALGPDEIASICEAGAVGKCRPSDNHAPRVNAGPDLGINSIEQSLTLRGSVSDDGLPDQGELLVEWKQLSGPGVATFAEVYNPQSSVSFSAVGRYELELSARDGMELARDVVEITVGQPCVIGEDASLVGWWSGNRTTEDVLGEHDGFGAFVTYEPGKVGSAFKLNGGSYVRVPVSVDEQGNNSLDVGKGSWTVELWANPDAYRLYPVLLEWRDAAGAGPAITQSGEYLYVTLPGGGIQNSGAGVLPAGQWTHIAVSYERATGRLRFYANGQLTADHAIGASLTFATNKDLWIGGHAGADKFRGLLDEVSIYNRALAPTDIAALFNAGSIGKCHPQPPNAAPVAQAGADRSIQLPRNYLILAGTATDDGLPSGSTLAYEWSQVSGPGEVFLSNPASPTATATFPLRGSYVLRLSVSDGALSSEDDITVTVLPPENQAPEVNAGIDRVISIQEPSITLSGSVEDDGEPQGSTVSISWSKISGPGDVVFADRFELDTQASFSAVGTYVLQLAATDGVRTGTDTVQVRVVTPPSVRISSPANYTLVSPGGTVPATAAVTAPDAPIVSVEFFLDDLSIGAVTAAPYTVATPSLVDGVHTLTAQAVDSNGLRAISLPLTLRAATDSGVAPSVTIANVDNGHVITAPTEITGTVQSPILREWALEYRRLNDECAEWIVFKTGVGPVENGILGTFDPTLLLNGNYAIRLTARDFANRAVATTRIVVVEGDMKVGHFTVAFQDLQLPLAGLPLTVTRTYDSRDRCPGDFGFGWRLDLETIRLEKSHRIGDGWETQVSVGSPSYYQIADSVSHQLSVKMPDGELLRFQPKVIIDRPYNRLVSLLDADGDDVGQVFAPIAYQQPLRVIYRARGGHRGATLRALNYRTDGGFFGGGVRNVPGDGQFYISDQMEGQLLLAAHDNSAQEAPFMLDATGWELIIQDGRVFVFDAEGRLSSMRDRSGRSLTITRDFQGRVQKVRHSSGQEIVFARNQAGFVQSITDPRGNVLRYVYNAAGDLQQFFDRGTDPQTDLPSTSFTYAPGTHFLTDLRDARGVQAAKNFYDEEGRLWKTVDAKGKEIVFTHNIEGRIETIRDRAGQVTRHQYDTRGNIVRTESPDGTVSTMAYHRWSDGVLSNLKTSETVSGLIADSTGQKVPQTLTTSFVYEDDDPATPPANDGLLRKLVDPKGNVTRFTYDANGNVLTATDARANAAGGNPAPTLVNTYYPGTDHIQTTTDALGNVTSFTYDPRGNLDKESRQVTVTGESGETTVQTLITDYDYDSFGRLVKVTDALGHATTYEYDLNGNRVKEITTRTGADGKLVTLVTEHEYDANDRLTRSWLPDNPRSNFNTPPSSETLYDGNGKAAVTYDALRRGTVNEYNERGELIQTTFPDGATEQVVYDAEGRREATIDRRGMRTQYVYDVVGRLKETWFVGSGSDAPVRLSATEYDAAGRIWKSTDANGSATTYGYDAAGRRVLVKDAKGRSSIFGFDENGNQTTFTDHYGRTTTHVYDTLNRRTHTVYPAAEIWTGTAYESKVTDTVTVYDELGRRVVEYEQSPVEQSFAARRFKQFVYDGNGRLRAVVAPSVRHADGQVRPTVTRYEYDELGNQTAQIDAEGRVTTYTYDNAGRRIRRTLPEGQTEQVQYDGAGRMRFRTDFNGRTTEFRYDVMGRLRFRVPDPVLAEPAVEWRYTVAGQRERMIDASGTTLYGYDSRGRLTSKATAAGTLGYTYDAAGNILSIASSSRDGAAMLYSYDELNRLATVTDANGQVIRYGYDEVGNLGSVSLPNGVVSGYSYNAVNRLVQLTHGAGAGAQMLLAGYSYGLAANGQRVVAADANGRTSSYFYDALGRLEQETISGDQSLPTARNGQIGYVYDAVGNRLSRTSSVTGLAPQAFGYDSNDRVQGDSYDQNGNTVAAPISQSANAFASLPQPATGNPQPVIGTDVYDSQDRLRERTGASGARVQVIYDGDGHKVREVVTRQGSSTVTSYLVDELNPTGYAQVVEEKTNGTVTRVYTYGLDLISQDQLIGPAASGTWKLSYYGYDGHGNVRFLTDETGAVTDRYDFDAFGTLLSVQGSTPNLYLYCGEQYDGALGLYYLRARLMNPLSGRFWTADTYEGQNSAPQSLHKYLYANADSVNGWDPSGFFSVLELNAVNVIRAIGNEANLVAGTTASDTVLYGPIVASASIYTGAAITAGAAAALPFARAIAAPLSKFGRLASEALPGGIVGLSRLSFRCRVLALPYEMLLETMKLAGMTARGYEAGHLLPDAIFTAIPRSHGLAIPMFGSVAEQYSQHWKFHRTLEVAWDVSLRIRGRFPNVGEFLDNILPDALQNADMDPYTASILADACKEQALKFGYALKDQLPKLFRNTKQ